MADEWGVDIVTAPASIPAAQQRDLQQNEQEERVGEIGSVGILQGVPPGRNVHHVGVLDLRQVPAQEVAKIHQIGNADVILLDESNRLALGGVRLHHSGSVLVADPQERVIVTPQLDISGTAMEAMEANQRLLLVGNLFLKPDVSPAMAAEKIASLRVAGILVASESVHGALLGKMQVINGVILVLPDGLRGPILRDAGETQIRREYLENLPDDITFLNFGRTELHEDVPPELLRQKMAAYYNAGETIGPYPLIAVLQARCPINLGSFRIH